MGAVVGAGAGFLSGSAQVLQARDDVFKSYYNEQYKGAQTRRQEELERGSAIAAGRETDLISFSTLFKSQETARGYLKDLTWMANTTPLLYDDLTAMSKTLATYGYGAKEILPVLTTVGDTGAALSMSVSDMNEVATALGRMKSSNKTTLEYLNILNDRGVGAVGILADSFKVDQATMYDMISKGKVAGSEAVEIILSALVDSFSGSMEQQSKTFSGLSSTLEGWQQELENAGGERYNEIRGAGKAEQIAYYDGANGEAVGEMNGIIASGKAYQENLKERYQREAEAAVLRGTRSFTYNEEQREDLAEMRDRYLAAKEAFDHAAALGDTDAAAKFSAEVESIKGELEAYATDAFNVSTGMQEVKDVQLDMIAAIRENTAALGAWKDQYELDQAGTIGIAGAHKNTDGGQFTTTSEAYSRKTRGTFTYVPAEDGSHAFGLQRVPYDGYRALLHEGERVLPAAEARAVDSGGGGGVNITITGNEFTVRSEADIDAIARALAEEVVLRRKAGVL